jgi:hypothetical protein
MANGADRYVTQIAAASLDILGVRKLLGRDDQAVSAIDAVTRFVGNATSSGVYREPHPGSKLRDLFDADLYFGDSVYLFADPARPIQSQVEDLVMKVAPLITLGIQQDPVFLVRAGIAVGDLRTRVVRNERGQREIRLGTAMLHAHVLETSQIWVGGAIAEGLLGTAIHGTVAYPVPLRSGTDADSRLALNWIAWGWTLEKLESRLHSAFSGIGLTDEDRPKLENTLAFVRHVIPSGRFGFTKVDEG